MQAGPGDNIVSVRTASFMTRAGVSGGLLAAAMGGLHALLGSRPDLVIFVLAALICWVTVLLWRAFESHRLVAHFGVLGLTALFSFSVVWGSLAYVAWLGLVSVVAFMLTGRVGGLVWTAIILVLLGLCVWVINQGSVPVLSQGTPVVRILRVLSLVPALAVIAFFYDAQQTRDLAALTRALAAQSRLLAHVSHEMRTPLNGIIGTVQALRLEPSTLSRQVGEGLETIQSSGETLLALINDLLDVARAEAGTSQVRHPFDARRAVELTVALHQARAKATGHELQLVVPQVTVPVLGDSVHLQQVVGNLVVNALRHGQSPVRVCLEATRGPEATELVFSVRDNGPGITPADQALLFKPFAQLNAGTTAGGSGLGLFISRSIARHMGGELFLESAPGAGSTFSLRLTLPSAVLPSDEALVPVQRFRGQVLVVDDNPINLKVAQALLSKLGLEVLTLDSGERALAHQGPIDLVFMDLQMPGIDGFETARRLRQNGLRVPIIALTASAQPETEGECLRSGMNGCLVKPVRLEHLCPLLARVLPV